ncbi:MAG: ABC transporter ATP-binding protein [Thermoplasmatota archaeon]
MTLEARGLARSFGETQALRGVSLRVDPGRLLAVVGPSGCGKTTLLTILAGLAAPQAGRVLLDGEDITGVPAQKRRFGFVFQDHALFPHLTVLENVAFGLEVQGVKKKEARDRALQALDLVHLSRLAARRPHELSGGEAQRVALARAVAPKPRVLLLDEPLASLDRRLRESLRREVRRLHDELQLRTIYVTHDRDEALTLGDDLLLLRDGRVEESGTPSAVLHEPQSAYGAGFFGAWAVLRAHRQGAQALTDVGLFETRFTPGEAGPAVARRSDLGPAPRPASAEGGDGWVLVRPSDLRFEAAIDGPARVAEFRPHTSSAWIQTGASEFEAAVDAPVRPGTKGTITVLRREARFIAADGRDALS